MVNSHLLLPKITPDTAKYVETRLVGYQHPNPTAKNGGSVKIDNLLLQPKNSVFYDANIYSSELLVTR
jgi:hypothetical protein